MSIFVGIPCIGFDDELIRTVRSVLKTAYNQNDVHIGVVIIGEDRLYQDFIENFKDNKNIKVKFYNYENNIGIGKARTLVKNLYDNEDYYLQIDSHSRMSNNWDEYLVKKYKEAQKLTNNKKTILTGTPAHFKYKQVRHLVYTEDYHVKYLGLNMWNEPRFLKIKKFINWGHTTPRAISQELDTLVKETGFAPAAKVCAAFIFGNKYFVENSGLSEDALFWEEEISQSINLIDDGFTLVYPGEHPVIYHLYKDDIVGNIGNRPNLFDIFSFFDITADQVSDMLEEKFNAFMEDPNNQNKIKKFEEYNKIKFGEVIHDLHTYPNDYINLGYLPL